MINKTKFNLTTNFKKSSEIASKYIDFICKTHENV